MKRQANGLKCISKNARVVVCYKQFVNMRVKTQETTFKDRMTEVSIELL